MTTLPQSSSRCHGRDPVFGETWPGEMKEEVRNRLLHWFAGHRRSLPWRDGYDPYQVWIAEVMGQQTRMDRVVRFFQRWIDRFPDPVALAAAPEQEVLRYWEGMGYYARARNLVRAARIMVEKHGGRVPDRWDRLLALPGVGPYTAAAILSIAFQQPYPLVDANVERLLVRLLDLEGLVNRAPLKARVARLAEELFVPDRARDFNQALMEFGALVCTPRGADCDHCPLSGQCLACLRDTVHLRPERRSRASRIDIRMVTVVIVHQDRIYIQQRSENDVWGGLWEFPGGEIEEGETPARAAVREVSEETGFVLSGLRYLTTVVHHYTRYRVTLHGFRARLSGSGTRSTLNAAVQYRWVDFSALADFAFPAGHRRLIHWLAEYGEEK